MNWLLMYERVRERGESFIHPIRKTKFILTTKKEKNQKKKPKEVKSKENSIDIELTHIIQRQL